MNERPIALSLLGATVLLVGVVYCTTSGPTPSSPHELRVESGAAKDGYTSASLSLERTTCFGSCPSYSVTLYSSGTGVYEGLKYVVDEGPYKLDFDPARLGTLVSKAQQILATLQQRSAEWPISDVAYVKFALTVDGQLRHFKSPYFYGVFPDTMGGEDRELHRQIESLAMEIEALGNVWPMVGTQAENRALYDAERAARLR